MQTDSEQSNLKKTRIENALNAASRVFAKARCVFPRQFEVCTWLN